MKYELCHLVVLCQENERKVENAITYYLLLIMVMGRDRPACVQPGHQRPIAPSFEGLWKPISSPDIYMENERKTFK